MHLNEDLQAFAWQVLGFSIVSGFHYPLDKIGCIIICSDIM